MSAISAVFKLLAKSFSSEVDYRDGIVEGLMYDLLEWNNHLQKEFPVQMGSGIKRVDIMLLSNSGEKPLLPIEVKTSKNPQDGVSQLYSYMRLLGLEIGLVFNDKIYAFYFDKNRYYDQQSLSYEDAAWTVSFNDCAENINLFSEMFGKKTFDIEKLKTFLLGKIQERDIQRQKEEQVKEILSEINPELIEDLLMSNFEADEDIIREALSKVEITVSRKNKVCSLHDTDNEIVNQEREYFVDGVSSTNKNEFVRTVVGKYLKAHPSMTYVELKNALSSMAPKIINDIETIKRFVDDGHKPQWSRKEFKSADNVVFCVYNQWEPINFKKVINFAKMQDYIK